MQSIHSKDIFYLLRETLKLFDRRPIVHGGKVAYYVYKMLRHKGELEDFELADIMFLVTFHDIGAYRTDEIEQMLRYDTKEYHAHSLYGQLFLDNWTSFGEYAKVIFHHHTDFSVLKKSNFKNIDLASYINLAEAIDIFRGSLGDKFDLEVFKKQVGSKFSPEAFELFCQVNEEYNLFEQVGSGAYKQETNELMDYFILSNEDKVKLLEFLMFTISLKSDNAINNAVLCVALCEKLGVLMKLNPAQQKNLLYAAYVHDIGFLAFRKNWIDEPAKLNTAHMEKFAHHTLMMEQLLKDRIKRDVIVIAAAHHERADGNGYPRRLTEKQMNLSQLILQFADAVSVMMAAPLDKDKLISKIKKQTEGGYFSPAVTKVFIDMFDEIVEYTAERTEKILKNYKRLNEELQKSKA
ncbi:MAG: HD domain-containing protein [Lachnospiraceae bacterium]|nr:HD domain-containing protein [Lachnospiraceae bacterium]